MGAARLSWNMAEALSMGRALGMSELIIAEILPEIEPVVMAALRDKVASDG